MAKRNVKYWDILGLSADMPESLRPTDVDRVMKSSNDFGCAEGFREFLLESVLMNSTRKLVEEWKATNG
jgi:hypothetical protein